MFQLINLTHKNLHFIEVRHFGDVNQVEDRKVFHLFSDAVQHLVHFHTGWVPVVTETDDLISRKFNEIKIWSRIFIEVMENCMKFPL